MVMAAAVVAALAINERREMGSIGVIRVSSATRHYRAARHILERRCEAAGRTKWAEVLIRTRR